MPATGCLGTCANSVCNVDCNGPVGCNQGRELCAKDLPCNIECTAAGTCADVRCTTSKKCLDDLAAKIDAYVAWYLATDRPFRWSYRRVNPACAMGSGVTAIRDVVVT